MVTLRLVGQHMLVDIVTTIHLCEWGGRGRCGGGGGEGVGGVEDDCTYIQWRMFLSGCGVCTGGAHAHFTDAEYQIHLLIM